VKTDKIFIKGGRVIDPLSDSDKIRDILIKNGRISEGAAAGCEIIEAQGMAVCPGLIDMHAHLREPGREDEETIETGTMAAVHGGYTAVAAMGNTEPPADNASVIKYILDKSRASAKAKVIPIGTVSKSIKGCELSNIGELVSAGAAAVSDDGMPVMNSFLMRNALEYCKMFGIPVISHCEDASFSEGVVNEGRVSAILGLQGIPSCSEEILASRDIMLSKLTGGKVHIAHVSTKGCVEIIRRAKNEGINVTAEATPHHLALTEDNVLSFDTNFRMTPPLRTKEDVAALREGLKDGTIDIIATDHAPHSKVEKENEFAQSPPGVTGLETALSVIITYLVEEEYLTLKEAVTKLTLNPARILGIEGGTLKPGSPADICVFDPSETWTVSGESFFSKSHNSAFLGRKLKGVVKTVICGGKTVFLNGRFV
jgi:dihydroorotase